MTRAQDPSRLAAVPGRPGRTVPAARPYPMAPGQRTGRARRHVPFRFLAGTGLLLGWALTSWAQAQLLVTYMRAVYPPGGQQGTSLDVRVSGDVVEDVDQLIFSHPGIRSEVKRAQVDEFATEEEPVFGQFRVTIAADVPPGMYEARAVGRFGVSNPRVFVVGRREEVIENGSNGSPEAAQNVPLGVTVTGRIDANARDFYRVNLVGGQTITLDCAARRIDSPLDAVLVVLDANGRELARSQEVERDPILPFTAPSDGEYLIGVRDHIFSGGEGHVYRLAMHADPFVLTVQPPALPPGQSGSLTLIGWNLPAGKPNGMAWNGVPLVQQDVDVTVPREPDPLVAPLVAASPLLAQATEPANYIQVHESIRVPVYHATAPVVPEQEPNQAASAAQKLELPCEVAGRFYPESDEDWYEFSATKGQTLWIEVVSHRMGSDCDPYLMIYRVAPQENAEPQLVDVAQVDDPGDRNARIGKNFDTSTDDPSYTFVAPEDGNYRVMVRDQFGSSRNDPRAAYRLIIRPKQPRFVVLAAPEQIKVNNANQVDNFALALRRGGNVPLRVLIHRLEDFTGEITLRAKDLPPGVSCRPITVSASDSESWLVLSATPDAEAWTGPIQVEAAGKLGDQEITTLARTGCVVWGSTNIQSQPAEFRPTQQLLLSIVDRDPAVARAVLVPEEILETSLGGKLELPVHVDRFAEFKEALKLVAQGLPKEIKASEVNLNADQADGTLTLEVNNPRTQPGTYTLMLRADSKVKASRNPDEIVRAQAQQQRLDEVVKKLAADLQQATGNRDATQQKVKELEAAVAEAMKTVQTAEKAVEAATAELQKADEKLAQARQQAEAKPEQAELKEAVSAAEAAQTQATESRATAQKQLETTQASARQKSEELVAGKAAAEQAEAARKQLEDQHKRATDVKKAADQRVANAQKNYAVKDVNIALVSTPVTVRIHATPLQLAAQPPAEPVKPESKLELPVTIERQFGFAEPVELQLELPKGKSGVSAAKLNVPADQKTAALQVEIAKDAAAGDFPLTIKASGKFNNVPVTGEITVTLTVVNPPAE